MFQIEPLLRDWLQKSEGGEKSLSDLKFVIG